MGPGEPDIPPHVLEQAARRYVLRIARRYAPLAVAGLAVLLVVLFLPSVSHNPSAFVAGPGSVTAGSRGTGTSAAGGGTDSSAAPAGGTTGGSLSGTATSGGAGSNGSSGGSGAGTTGGGGSTSSAPPGGLTQEAAGVSKTGVACGSGVRQFGWSAYAPPCVPAFHGNNGGATASGVTPSTITITYREASSSSDSTALSYVEGANAGSDPQYIADLQTYVNYFNTQFELYGRKVVLKPYNAQGDPLQEDQGQNLEGAQADAATAKDMGAFSDVSLPLGSSTQPYDDDLAQNHISSWGEVYVGRAEELQYAPYIYSALFPDGDAANSAYLDIMCRRMVGLPAEFAGDATYQKSTRKFGLILPDRPGSKNSQNEFNQGMAACGGSFAKEALYTIDVSQMASQATSILAQMRAAGVTTIMCGCDPIFDILLTQAADQQKYDPEWLTIWWSDAFAQLTSQDQWAHAIANGGTTPDLSKTEAFTAFQLASHNGQPQERFYSVPYLILFQLFSAIQQAGPNLNPQTFANAYFSLPGGTGTFGPFGFSSSKFNPTVAFQVGWWNSNAISAYNGKKGAYQTCNGGQFVFYNALQALAPNHTQLHCFGK